MKVTQKTFAGAAARAAQDCRIFYFCGPDEAGAADAAARIAGLLGEAERVELAGAELRRDPVRLADEARSVSLFGDRRQIHVRTAGDEVFDAVETLLASPVDGWPVLIVASAATDKSRVAKLLGDRGDTLVGMFHPPDLRSVVDAVRDMAGAAGLRMTGDLAERIARATALDTRMARSEVEKLALYLDASPQSPRTADAAALDAIGASTEDDGMMPVVNAVLSGDSRRIGSELARAREMGINPVGLLLAFERRAAQLAQLAGRMGSRSDINSFLEQEMAARRVFFRDKPDLANQLKRWRGRRLERLLQRLISLHRSLLADSRNADLALWQALAEIARAAAR
ncbi:MULTISPECIES: DNA polymerase III subunit delta [unclassified Novosphingobium]|uniref:DNA polymerase III subunit delta n=1 Tax=unclassified Novosphingobium TaxID=2644732 RepID=UPI000D3072C2|nr:MULTISPECIES: DNA polymerase III subunit delta [unclassified Novosphingobium]PTR09782.1 DNA polymerase III delta subunit [Novosphingobium sp. GV055]PUB02569.1 DNA polymerase III delta subunit [Novosphingobium sp. GV061]PUB19514.1 DNA polymerase III delta subunit [Novosphingobium sp. GV079]PUB40938.1 DNA polymerase III delta subunit [Novosphingobium sp. GV027]